MCLLAINRRLTRRDNSCNKILCIISIRSVSVDHRSNPIDLINTWMKAILLTKQNKYLVVFTGGDIFIHAKSHNKSKLFELTQRIMAQLPAGSVESYEDIYGWVYQNGKDLSGFIDGKSSTTRCCVLC